MELAILIAYYLIIKSVGTTIGNTAALLQGRPVQVRRPAPVGGGQPIVGPSYTGRAIGTVAAVAKESVAAGAATGWATGKAKFAARQDKRAMKKAAKAAGDADDQPDGVGPAPGPTLTTAPAANAPAESGPGIPADPGEPPRLVVDPEGRAQSARDRVMAELADPMSAAPPWVRNPGKCWWFGDDRVCGLPSHPQSFLGLCDRHTALDLGSERPMAYITPWQTAEGLRRARRCWHRADHPCGRGEFCGRWAAASSPQGMCSEHDPAAAQAGSIPTPAATGSDEPSDRGTVLFLVPQPASEGKADRTAEPSLSPPGQPAPAVPTPPTFGGVMTTTVSAETTTIGATRGYLTQLATYVQDSILSQLELAEATLRGAEMDAETLGHLAAVSEYFAAAKAGIESALATLNTKHALMEEAVQSTPDAATRDFYRE